MLQKRIDDQPTISREMIREAEQILHRHLKRVGLKHTAQRDTILRTFLETREHLSTDQLYRLVRKKDPKVGFTTVYRTLKLLAECGLASEVAFHVQDNSPERHCGPHELCRIDRNSRRSLRWN